eukprot:FR744371.1.p2 GENE.FR744371.1~~FR744371.1.p2  ORF type:complete len:107 (+),score=12.65 FR744371.1:618-938(+)
MALPLVAPISRMSSSILLKDFDHPPKKKKKQKRAAPSDSPGLDPWGSPNFMSGGPPGGTPAFVPFIEGNLPARRKQGLCCFPCEIVFRSQFPTIIDPEHKWKAGGV